MQYLTDLFWKRWVKKYLPTLQNRQKWNNRQPNISPGDIVLITDNLPRGPWGLGRVVEVFKDKDGLVRSVLVKTKNSTVMRPITKWCSILEAGNV